MEPLQPESAPANLPQSVLAVLAGWAVTVLLSLGTDQALQMAGVYPGWGQPIFHPGLNLLALGYRCAYTGLGCYIAGRLAPRQPLGHALILGLMTFLFCLLGAMVAIQNHFGPAWYPLSLAATALPSAWLGGSLAQRAERD